MSDFRAPSRPPSDPYAALARGRAAVGVAPDRPTPPQLVAASLVGLLLLTGGLFMWRVPRSPSDGGPPEATAGKPLESAADDDAGDHSSTDAGARGAPVVLSGARVVGCHDRGSRKTPPEACDHLVVIERALSMAIERAVGCIPPSPEGATVEYLADVSFTRHKVRVSLPRLARTVQGRKVVSACAAAVRDGMAGVALGNMGHEHARYQISITATYPGKS